MGLYLVTGGAGFIGSNFIRYLINEEKNSKFIVYDSLTYSGLPFNLSPFLKEDNIVVVLFGKDYFKFERSKIKSYKKIYSKKELEDLIKKFISKEDRLLLIVASITNLEPLKVVMTFIDNLFHFAAETHVDRSIMYPHRFVFTDVVGTYFLLYAFKEINGQRGKFIHISTDEIYGEIIEGKAKEDSPLYPSSPYSASKAGADRLVYSFYKTYGLPVIIVRPSNVFGERQFPEKFIPLSIMKVLMKEKIPIYGDGKQIRSWIYQEDAVRGIYLIFKKGKIGEEYNLPGNTELENIKVAEIICDLAGVEKEKFIEFLKDRPAHDRRYSLDGTKLFSLGFKYSWNFNDAIKKTFEFYKQNFRFYKKLLKEKKVKKFMDVWYSKLKGVDEV
ncbi:MAG: GDP-mannose 4,6-dehydratase [Candidatus Hydrothermales bacterium]